MSVAVAVAGACCNLAAAIILIGALIPPFLDTKRSRKTFAISEKFFLFYSLGSVTMLINAIANVVAVAVAVAVDAVMKLIMFSALIVANTVSTVLNSYMWSVKRRNVKNAKAANLTEQEYWSTVIKPQLGLE